MALARLRLAGSRGPLPATPRPAVRKGHACRAPLSRRRRGKGRASARHARSRRPVRGWPCWHRKNHPRFAVNGKNWLFFVSTAGNWFGNTAAAQPCCLVGAQGFRCAPALRPPRPPPAHSALAPAGSGCPAFQLACRWRRFSGCGRRASGWRHLARGVVGLVVAGSVLTQPPDWPVVPLNVDIKITKLQNLGHGFQLVNLFLFRGLYAYCHQK